MQTYAKNVVVVVALAFSMTLGVVVVPAKSAGDAAPHRLRIPDLPNAIRLHPKVISGGSPNGEAGFRQLAKLGVKTVISVDGLKPDVSAAKRAGIRYVHLPHGYDGIEPARVRELAKAVHELPGPIYIHCHHGKHRSPAAAVSACITLGYLSRQLGERILRFAGTSPNYAGLYTTVRDAKPLPRKTIEAIRVQFRETVELPPIVEVMTKLETIIERLERHRNRDWLPADSDPDRTAAHDALLLQQTLTELMRDPEVHRKELGFRTMLQESEAAAMKLQASLSAKTRDTQSAGMSLKRVRKNCVGCHESFRN